MPSTLRASGRDRAPSRRDSLVADFEDRFEASFGEWDVTTDQMTGGSSSAGAIPFRTRGDGRQYSVILISSAAPAVPPPTVTSIAPTAWTPVEIRLVDFPTASPEVIAGLAFVAEEPVGASAFEMDDVAVG